MTGFWNLTGIVAGGARLCAGVDAPVRSPGPQRVRDDPNQAADPAGPRR